MLSKISKDIINNYMIRCSKKDKENFREFLNNEIKDKGFNVENKEEKYLLKNNNIIVGDIKKAELILTAHYDTPKTMPFPNFIAPKHLFISVMYSFIIFFVYFLLLNLIGALLFADYLYIVLFRQIGVILGLILLFAFPNKNNFNDNTSGVVTLLEIINNLDDCLKEKVAFVFFDNEEWGLLGSSAFLKNNREIDKKLIFNFDCVGDGDSLMFVTRKAASKDLELNSILQDCLITTTNKESFIAKATTTFYPSDQMVFNKGIGVAALKKNKIVGYYLDKIHTNKDTNLDEANINILKDIMIKFIGKI